jgi:hypothetical protein
MDGVLKRLPARFRHPVPNEIGEAIKRFIEGPLRGSREERHRKGLAGFRRLGHSSLNQIRPPSSRPKEWESIINEVPLGDHGHPTTARASTNQPRSLWNTSIRRAAGAIGPARLNGSGPSGDGRRIAVGNSRSREPSKRRRRSGFGTDPERTAPRSLAAQLHQPQLSHCAQRRPGSKCRRHCWQVRRGMPPMRHSLDVREVEHEDTGLRVFQPRSAEGVGMCLQASGVDPPPQ